MKSKQIIFVYPVFSTFVKKDYDSLSKKAKVLAYHYKPEKQFFKFILELLKLKMFLLKNIRKTDILICWFADYHSFFPTLFSKVFNKKSFIIVGGNDAVSIPEIEYGIFYKKGLRYIMASWSYRMADAILPVHKSLIESTNYYVDKRGVKIGVKHFVKNLDTKFIDIPTGYDSFKWFFKAGSIKEQLVITVAGIHNMKTYKGKGIDLFIEVAKKIPTAQFVIIGVSSDMRGFIKKDIPNNVSIQEYVENNLLVDYISKAKVYCQFSLTEGLPNALCEAMLCECIPVGSSVNGIPDGIGDAGFVLMERNVESATELVKKALASNEELGRQARQHIIDHFSHEKRERTFDDLFELS
jgi:glycosyltransferase involved in cell wall biosynthesis